MCGASCSGSVDNTAIISNVHKNQKVNICIFTEYLEHFPAKFCIGFQKHKYVIPFFNVFR